MQKKIKMVASASIIKHRVMKKSNLIIVLLVLLFVGVVDSFSQKHIVRTTKLRAAGHKTTRPVKKEEKKRDGKKARYD